MIRFSAALAVFLAAGAIMWRVENNHADDEGIWSCSNDRGGQTCWLVIRFPWREPSVCYFDRTWYDAHTTREKADYWQSEHRRYCLEEGGHQIVR